MFDSSPIETWEGAGAIFNSAGSTGEVIWFWIAVALCVWTVISAVTHENKTEREKG